MPNIASHMVIAKLVGEKLKIEENDFIRGNLLPDIINKEDSHQKIKGTYFDIPNIDYFKSTLDLTNPKELGYYTHLLLDKYFLEEFIPIYLKRKDVFENGIIYEDYTAINNRLVKKFNLDIEKIKKALKGYKEEINKEKLEKNIKYLETEEDKTPTYIKFEELSNFLEEISIRIIKEIQTISK